MNGQTTPIHTRRRGQTLVEFALTLPILLILLFGVIEFGRIFQAWVTLQNSARAAVRLAATGQFDEQRYRLDSRIYDIDTPGYTGDLDSIVPCQVNQPLLPNALLNPVVTAQNEARAAANRAQRGTQSTITPYPGATPIQVFTGGVESIYATFYGGDDCDPADADDQNRRRDLARILSIYDEARRGAAGLALGPQVLPTPPVGVPADLTGYPDFETLAWAYPWFRPLPGDHDGDPGTPPQYYRQRFSDEPGWFDVMICSNRGKLDDRNNPQPGNPANRFRFPPFFQEGPFGASTDPRAPACMLLEHPTAGGQLESFGWTDNAYKNNGATPGVPWWDAGGPGDTVALVVTFNHPLVTPLGIAPFIPLQARRVAVNESFRAPRAVPIASDLPIVPGVVIPTAEPTNTPGDPPEETPTNTHTPSATFTASPTFTATNTPVFQCSNISLSTTLNYVGGQQVAFTLNNSLSYPTELRRAQLVWSRVAGAPSQIAQVFQLNGSVIWSGADAPNTDVGNVVAVGPGTPAPLIGTPEYPFAPASNLLLQPGANTFLITFANGPTLTEGIMPRQTFNGTTFYYDDLEGATECAVSYNYIPPVPTVGPTPTFTNTPVCEAGGVTVSQVIFQSLNIVRFDIVNNRTVNPATVIGFNLVWNKRNPSMVLSEVWGGGTAPGAPGSTRLWVGPDANPNTSSGEASSGVSPIEGTWETSLFVPPGGTLRRVFFLFSGGGSGTVATSFGSVPADFNNTTFYVDAPACPVSVSTLISTEVPSPTNTATRTSTFTPTFTNTATNTFTPTATFTASRTPTFTNTATFTATFTASRTPTFTATFTASQTPSRTPTPTPTPTFTPTFTPSITPTFTRTFTPSQTFTPSRTFTATATHTASATRTPSATRTFTPTNTATLTPSQTFTPSRTFTPSQTFTRTNTPLPTSTPTNTATFTRTFTPTNTPTSTFTFTPSPTRTFTPTFTATLTLTPSLTPSPTFTRTFTPTFTPSITPTRTPSPTRTPLGQVGGGGG
jgi:Flp pilus assembly protein TadG